MNQNLTKVHLLNVPLENDYKNTLFFTNKNEQNTYFSNNIIHSFTDLSYQRKDFKIRVPKHIDTLWNCNYVMYQNTYYNNKWFYAFITDMSYINDKMTEIKIETDVMQTWFFDFIVKPSFVEREHVSDDTIGLHTLPENLESGEYICGTKLDNSFGSAHVVIAATYDCFNNKDAGSLINGIYHGVDYFLIGPTSTEGAISYFLSVYEDRGKVDSITGIFMVPDNLTNYGTIDWDFMVSSESLSNFPYKKLSLNTVSATDMGTFTIAKPLNNVDGYTPRNKKLFTFPYKYLKVSNNNGSEGIYKYEEFTGASFQFNTKGVITPGCSIRTAPVNYKGVARNNSEGLNLGKYPVCSYNTDVYTNWLTQNSVNIGLSVASSALTMVGGVGLSLTGAGALAGGGAIVSGAMGIASSMGQVYQHSLIPPQAEGNLNCGDVIFSNGECNFSYYMMNIKQEYAKIIDKYFDMFGYKVNMVKTPNRAHRARWWYTKCIDVNIDGAIPNKDMEIIKRCYNNGVTYWRNANEIQNYNLGNGIAITEGAVTG